jgi:excisionase family DNA binding protein
MKSKIEARLDQIEQTLAKLTASNEPKPLNVDEAAAYINTSKFHLYKLTCSGKIAFFKPTGKQLFFRKADLDAYLLRNRRAAAHEVEERAATYVVNNPVRRRRR